MYDIGDVVRVKTEEELSEQFEYDGICYDCDGLEFMPDMLKYCGCEMTVSFVDDGIGQMHFKEDEDNWWFNDSMVTPVDECDKDFSDDVIESIMKFVVR